MNLPKRMLLVSCMFALAAADWPQWRGPERNGISPEKGLAKTWPAGGPPLAWTFADAGTGYSAPAVAGGTVYILGARDNVEQVIALEKGKEKWAAKIGPLYAFNGNAWSGGPNAAPAIDGDSLYALGSQGEVVCVDLAKGAERWRVNMPMALAAEVDAVGGGPAKMAWGFSAAPLVDGDHLIVTPGGPKGLVAALNKKTGAVVWQSKGVTDPTTYAAPMATEFGGGPRMYVVMIQKGAVGISAKDGSVLWEHRKDNPYPDVVCSTPLVQGDLVYLTVGYGAGSELLKLTPMNGKYQVKSVYAVRDMGNRLGGVVLVDGNVYGFSEDRAWMCQDFLTGAVKWESNRRRDLKGGSVLYADGRLYCFTEDQGQVAMLLASPAGYKQVALMKNLPQASPLRKPRGKFWTHPVLADGKLYVRDQNLLFCFEVK